MADKTIRMRLATTHAIDAYGGLKLSIEDMSQIAARMKSGTLPMHVSHDFGRPLRSEVLDAGVERLPDGEYAAWANVKVDAAGWDAFEEQRVAAGAPGGMSISFGNPILGQSAPSDAPISLAADAHHFSDEEVMAAVAEISALAEAQGLNYFQLSAVPEAAVILSILVPAVSGVSLNVVSSFVYDAITRFIRPGKPTRIVFDQDGHGVRLRLSVTTDSKGVAKKAIDAAVLLQKTVEDGRYVYDVEQDSLRRLDD
jgi:hypothetical protein